MSKTPDSFNSKHKNWDTLYITIYFENSGFLVDCMQFSTSSFPKIYQIRYIYIPYILLYNVDNVALTCRLEICTKLGVLWAFISRVETTPSTSATHHGYCRMCDKSSRKSCKALEFVITCHRKKSNGGRPRAEEAQFEVRCVWLLPVQ